MNSRSLFKGFQSLLWHLPVRRRWQMVAVMALMLAGALAELVTIGAIIPFLAVLADPSGIQKHAFLARALAATGLTINDDALTPMAILFCGVVLLATLVRLVLVWASQKLVFRIGYDVGTRLYQRVLYQPYRFHVAQNSSRILTGIDKVQRLLQGMLLPFVQGLTALVIGFFIVLGMILVSAQAAFAAAIFFVIIYVTISAFTRTRLRRNGEVIARNNTARTKAVQEGLGGIRDILIDSSQPVYLAKFARIDTELRDAQAANALISATPRYVVEGLGMIVIVLMALILARGRSDFGTIVPTLGALVLGAQRLLPLLQQAYNGWTSVLGNRATFFDVLALLDEPLPVDLERRHGAVPITFDRELNVRDVQFSYAAEGPRVLDGISLKIKKGSRVGLIGRTGSGKSTLLDLVMGLLWPVAGRIEVDGSVLDDARIFGWQAQLAHVPQHIYLSDGSFTENVAFGVRRSAIDLDRVVEACRKADIHDFIVGLPDGYDTCVGERGIRLSGGQRQRIGIARALYKRASVLILDEATSALDDATEMAIVSSVKRLGPDLTVLMIAHRLSTLQDCDIIYRVENGKIIASGSYRDMVGGSREPEAAHDRRPS